MKIVSERWEKLKNLDVLTCQNLPFNFTIYREEDLCEKEEIAETHCDYCNHYDGGYHCHKQTTTGMLIFA